ncbi:protein kinase [Streptomyces sp. NPDC048604]|uniref:serine/threonine-protein kinase n=1 Tax=Streptomyces sp. NPDC048604 TaxID=3365578 RepID=UPI003721F25D
MEAGVMLADRYRLLAPIARGAQGTVWRAVDTRAAQGSGAEEVAVKVSGDAGVESLLRLVCEQSVRIGHPHVLTPLDWFVRAGEAWLVLPLVRGGTVAGLLADYGELPPSAGLSIAEQLLDALAAVHAAGLVHRDVKPSNVLLAATGEGRPHAYLGDFGVARVLPHVQLTSPGFVTGTPDYLAPEIRAGGDSSPAQDVYAAGLVLRDLGAPPALVAAMTAARPQARPSAAAARDELARARAALGPERWPAIWADEPFVIPDQFEEAPQAGDVPTGPGVLAASGRLAASTAAAGPVRRTHGRLAFVAAAGAVALAVAVGLALTTGDDGTKDAGPAASTPPATQTAPTSAPATRAAPTSAPSDAARAAPTAMPSDAARGLPDPEGPTPFTPCTADQALAVGFSPEGYALLCTHVPGTRAYQWRPAP